MQTVLSVIQHVDCKKRNQPHISNSQQRISVANSVANSLLRFAINNQEFSPITPKLQEFKSANVIPQISVTAIQAEINEGENARFKFIANSVSKVNLEIDISIETR